MTQSYKDLIVWQKAMDLVMLIYKITEAFPDSEKFGLVSQMRRCSISIPSNVAEGRRRSTRKDYRTFINIAYGSGAELETQLEISRRLNYVDEKLLIMAKELLEEVMKILNKFLSTLRS
ncbi:MAG: hypothetical protein BWY19_00958 [bacterium ADurb.Bin212]|nr:MAG: hypothetical protein BWY19_00958 [bacterium ADurb.Bin212]